MSDTAFSPVPDQQILAGAPATLTLDLLDQDGGPRDAAGAVTVEVTRDDGTVLVPAGTPATHAGAGSGAYTVDLAAVQTATLDILAADWTDEAAGTVTTTHVEIVGGHYVELGELRTVQNLANTTKYPRQKLIDARRWFEEKFERYTGRAFVSRYRRAVVWGDATDQIKLPDEYIRRVRSVTVGTTVLDADRVATLEVLGNGILRRPRPDPLVGQYPTVLQNGWPLALFGLDQKVTVAYEYGLDRPTADIRRAARVAIQAELLNDNVASRELSVQTEIGVVRMSYPGPDRPFGIPFCDDVANRWRRGDIADGTVSVGSVPIG